MSNAWKAEGGTCHHVMGSEVGHCPPWSNAKPPSWPTLLRVCVQAGDVVDGEVVRAMAPALRDLLWAQDYQNITRVGGTEGR